jgi:hypothetical protein
VPSPTSRSGGGRPTIGTRGQRPRTRIKAGSFWRQASYSLRSGTRPSSSTQRRSAASSCEAVKCGRPPSTGAKDGLDPPRRRGVAKGREPPWPRPSRRRCRVEPVLDERGRMVWDGRAAQRRAVGRAQAPRPLLPPLLEVLIRSRARASLSPRRPPSSGEAPDSPQGHRPDDLVHRRPLQPLLRVRSRRDPEALPPRPERPPHPERRGQMR